jgi:plastocyanin
MKKAIAVLALALAAVALVACGGGGDDNSSTATSTPGGAAKGGGTKGPAASGGGSTLKLAADPSGALAYDTKSLSAKAGNVTIDFTNDAPISHDVSVEDSSGSELGTSDLISKSSTTLDLSNLKPGSYTFFCTVPGHREGGMEGTLTVK